MSVLKVNEFYIGDVVMLRLAIEFVDNSNVQRQKLFRILNN